MSSSVRQDADFDRNLRPRERNGFLPRFALRRRSADHPMVMFAILVGTAVAAMALTPGGGQALVATAAEAASPVSVAHADELSPALSEVEVACRGQAWGAQGIDCVAAIARDAGRTDVRAVRAIPAGMPSSTAPNVF